MTTTISGTTGINTPALESTTPVKDNAPAFSAAVNAATTLTTGTYGKAKFGTVAFDTNTNYDPTINYRFTPTVAGYYQVNARLRNTGTTTNTSSAVAIFKNGVEVGVGVSSGSATTQYPSISEIVYMNGTTDYLEIFGSISGTGTLSLVANGTQTNFSASLVRAA